MAASPSKAAPLANVSVHHVAWAASESAGLIFIIYCQEWCYLYFGVILVQRPKMKSILGFAHGKRSLIDATIERRRLRLVNCWGYHFAHAALPFV